MRRPGREVPARARGDPAAERRELERLRVEAQRQPVRAELLLEPRAGRAGLDPRGARDAVDLEHAIQPPQVDRDDARVPRAQAAVDAADHARAAAERHDRDVALAAPVEHRAQLLLRAPGWRRRRAGAGTRPRSPRTTSMYERPARVRGARPRVARVRRLQPRRRQLDRRPAAPAPPAREPKPRCSASRGRARRAARPRSPSPSAWRRRATLQSRSDDSVLPTRHPRPRPLEGGSGGEPLARGRVRAARRPAARRPTRRSPRSRTAARPRTTGSPPGSPATRQRDGRLELELQPMRWSLRLVARGRQRLAGGAVRDARRRRALAGRPPRRVGRLVGRPLGARRRRLGRGRRGPGRDARRASSRRSGRWRPSGSPSRRWSRLPNRLAMLVGLAWLPEGAEVTPDAEHDEHAWWPRRPRRLAGGRRPGAAPDGVRCWHERAHQPGLSPLLQSYTHSVVYFGAAAGRLHLRPREPRRRARLGARHRLDRHVAALPRGRAPAGDPALAGRDGRRGRRRRPVRGEHRVLSGGTQIGRR